MLILFRLFLGASGQPVVSHVHLTELSKRASISVGLS